MTARALLLSSVLALSVALGGCLLPRRGTPVFVDTSAGDFFSGVGVLVAVSDDQTRCQVAVRDRALILRHPWVACTAVHPRKR